MKSTFIKEQYFFDDKPTISELKKGDVLEYIISGKATKADSPNGNNNIYPKAILNEAIRELRSRCQKGQVKMLMDHPEWEGKMATTAAVLLDITDVQEDGFAYYKAQIIDEGQGKILRSIIRAGGTVGVSTRGRGQIAYDQKWEGLPGSYNIIQAGFKLITIDFVEEPSVSETEDDVQIENLKKENTMKTLEELKKENPEVFKELESKHTNEVSSLKKAIEEAVSGKTKAESALKSMIESVKGIVPDMFVQIPESKLVEGRDKVITDLNTEINTLKSSLEESKSTLKTLELAKSKAEKDTALESLKAENPSFADYFKQEKVVKAYEACSTPDEVKKVFENHKAIMELGKKDNTPANPKTGLPESKNDGLTPAQEKHLAFLNEQRLASSMTAYSKEEYLKKYS